MSRGKVNKNKIDTWVSDEIENGIKAYMKKVDRNRADSLRQLLKRALETEGLLKELTK